MNDWIAVLAAFAVVFVPVAAVWLIMELQERRQTRRLLFKKGGHLHG